MEGTRRIRDDNLCSNSPLTVEHDAFGRQLRGGVI
jgi:hypothetical protein